jgi:hypothetical protein
MKDCTGCKSCSNYKYNMELSTVALFLANYTLQSTASSLQLYILQQ